MPRILVKTRQASVIEMLRHGKKPGYELAILPAEDPLGWLTKEEADVHGLLVDSDLITPAQVAMIKNAMDDDMFPVILFSGPMSDAEAGQWIGAGVSDIFQLPMPAPLMGKRTGSAIQLYRVNHSLHGQVTDKLTGLYNREAFYHFAREMMARYPEDSYTIILSDIDRFKRINETFGEEKGDELLRFVGTILNSMNSEHILFARYSGDQFVGIFHRSEKMTAMDEHLLAASMERFYSEAPVKQFRVQFGVYEDVDKSLPVSIMCDRAHLALKTIKHQYGRSSAMYTAQLQQRLSRELQILNSMEQAITEHQFQVYYQPKHAAADSALVGAEALVRWNHPTYGFMSPNDFVPLFERSGFITRMDEYVLHQVCADLRRMIDRGLPVVPVSVNASRKDFLTDSLIETARKPIEQYAIDTSLLHVELTESVYMENADIVAPVVKQLQEIGLRIELDDFGAGFSSLGILSRVPVDVIKLDKCLIDNIETQPLTVGSIIQLMHALGYQVTAEGVENDNQVSILRKMGCDAIQGYYYSRPLTYEGFCEYVQECAARKAEKE